MAQRARWPIEVGMKFVKVISLGRHTPNAELPAGLASRKTAS